MEIKNLLQNNLSFTSNLLSRFINEIADEKLLEIGLIPSEAYIILIVNETKGIQPKALSEIINLAPSTVTRLIEKLEKRSLITRTQSTKFVFLNPTTKSLDLNETILNKLKEIEQKTIQLLNETNHTQLKNSINNVINKL